MTSVKEQPAHVHRLQEIVKRELDRCDAELAERRVERDEYRTLADSVRDLPKKLSHPVMVPIGSVGFFPGRLVNTNQLTVLLGNNIFAERSAHQAGEIIGRRIEHIDEVMRKIAAVRKSVEQRLNYTGQLLSDNRDEVEIREDYDEATEKRAKEARRAAAAKKPARVVEEKNHDDMMRRLDELELLEKRGREMHKQEGEEEAPAAEYADASSVPRGVDPKEYAKLLARLDQLDDEADSDEEEVEDMGTDEEEQEKEEEEEEDELDSDDEPTPATTAAPAPAPPAEPAQPAQPAKASKPEKKGVRFPNKLEVGPTTITNEEKEECKSILRSTKPTPVNKEELERIKQREAPKKIRPQPVNAFTGVIVERSIDEPSTSAEPAPPPPEPKMSRFKARRMGMQ